jgi:hypothetical protein
MKEHLETESLSAYLDGELDDRELSGVEEHLRSCSVCSAAREALASAAKAVAALGPVQMTVDEHRALRQAVLKSRPSPAARRFGLPQWALAGSLVLVAVTALAFAFLRPGGQSSEDNASTQAEAPTGVSGSPNFAFSSGDDVDRTVAALPEVTGVFPRTAGEDSLAADTDAGARNSAESAPEAPPSKAVVPSPGSAAGSAAPGPQIMARTDGQTGPFNSDAADECLARVAATQDYPMQVLFAGEASFEGRPAWLLVYSWGPNMTEPGAAKQWQSWIVDPEDCANLSGDELEDRALYRSFSPTD